jgi:hypothetical protein
MVGRFEPLTRCETEGCHALTDKRICSSCARGIPPKKQRRTLSPVYAVLC